MLASTVSRLKLCYGYTQSISDDTMTKKKTPLVRAPKVVRQKLRSLAIDRVRKDIIHAGRKEADYSAEDLEYLVADKEKEIWSGVGWKSFGIVALLLGINIGI